MDDLGFLDEASQPGQVEATLKVVLPSGDVCSLSDRINSLMFIEVCPLLYQSFEDCPHGRLQASIEATSTTAVISLLRYCYTRTYYQPDAEFEPISLLPHIETYKIAQDFDLLSLRLIAQRDLTIQIERAMYQHVPPHDLFDTIRFLYRYYPHQQVGKDEWLLDTILSYIISVFAQYALEDDANFRMLLDQVPKFNQDLCYENMRRGFRDEGASMIIQISYASSENQSGTLPNFLASRHLLQEMVFDSLPGTPTELLDTAPESDTQYPSELPRATEDDADSHQPDSEPMIDSAIDFTSSSLPHRPTRTHLPAIFDIDAESSEDDHGFTLVYRPRMQLHQPTESCSEEHEPMSSPEVITTPVFDMLAASGTVYPYDEDEWDMLEG